MADTGIHSIVISLTKIFRDEYVLEKDNIPVSSRLFEVVNRERTFEQERIEIITKAKDFFKFSGEISGPIIQFNQVIPMKDYLKELDRARNVTSFNFWAEVRLSIEYSIDEYSDFLLDAEEMGEEHPNLFHWIEYCRDDALQSLSEEIKSEKDLTPLLTLRGN